MDTRILLVLFFLTGHVIGSSNQAAQDAENIGRIDDFINIVMACYDIPGLTLSLVKNKVPFLAKGYGLKDLDTQEPVTNQTMFVIASVTKEFVGTVVGQVLEKHNLTYDTPVRNILGDWFYMKDPYLTAKLSVTDALAHRAGLPGHDMMRRYMFPKREIYERLRHLDTTAPPRSDFMYNNIMYGLASYVAETLEGRDWEDLARDQIFTPLGMTATTFAHQSNDRLSEYATSYEYDGPLLRPIEFETISTWYSAMSAPGGMSSNAVDMTKWLSVQVNQGYTEANVSVISQWVLSETHEPAMIVGDPQRYLKPPEPVTFATAESYGLGFDKGYYRGYSLLGHTGVAGGFRSQLFVLPDMDIGFFISISGPMIYVLDPIGVFMMDLMLGKEPWLSAESVCEDPTLRKLHDQAQAPRGGAIIHGGVRNDYPVERLVGSYYNHAYAELRVSYDDLLDVLRIEYGPHISWRLTQTEPGEPRYEGDGEDPYWDSSVSRADFEDCDGEVCERVDFELTFLSPTVTFVRTLSPAPPPEPPCSSF